MMIDLINTGRYPIDALDSERGQAFLDHCRQRMATESSLTLPEFLRPDAIDAIVNDVETAPVVRDERLRTPYSWRNNLDFPEDHVRRSLFRAGMDVTLTDAFPSESLAVQLRDNLALTDFIRRLLGYETLYPSACPTLSVMASTMEVGDELGWHFDTNDGVVSILLQQPDEGGLFEFAPCIRSEDDENYGQVQALFAGGRTAERLTLEAGTFALFLGRRSIHRVTPVGPSSIPRRILLLSYDQQPGMTFTEEMQNSVRFPSSAPFLGTSAA